jgi:hypothetical protein
MSDAKIAEGSIAEKITLRGYVVQPFGQELLSDVVREELKKTQSLLRWLPDFAVIGSPHGMVLVDAKSATKANQDSPNYAIEMRSILAGEMTQLRVIYVFHDDRYVPVRDVRAKIARPCCVDCGDAFDDGSAHRLPEYCSVYGPRRGRGRSGTPFVLVRKDNCASLNVALPHLTIASAS